MENKALEEIIRKKVFRFVGVIQTVIDAKDLENYTNGFIKDLDSLITAREDRLVEILEKYKCGKHKKAIQLIREGDSE